jgi:hypothetical protein
MKVVFSIVTLTIEMYMVATGICEVYIYCLVSNIIEMYMVATGICEVYIYIYNIFIFPFLIV